MRDLDIFLSGFDFAWVRDHLSENNLEISFSTKKKIYYRFLRPILPLKIRQLAQRKVTRQIRHKEFFIYDDLVEKLKHHEAMWTYFIDSIYPDDFTSAAVISHDVETQIGFDFIPKVIEVESRYGLRGSWNIVPYKYKIDPGIIRLIKETGNEIGIHGFNHDGRLYYSKKEFSRRAKKINEAVCFYDAVGFRSPQLHRNLEWLQLLDIDYDASCFDYDPYQPFPGGTGCIWPFHVGKFIELPCTVPQDHVLFYLLGERSIGIWKRKTDWLVDNHGMVMLLTHPDYLMEKNHLSLYEEYLNYLIEIEKSWHCLPREIAAWWRRPSPRVVAK